MKRYILILLALVVVNITLPAMSLGAEEWESLFDGKTLNGWIQRNGKAKYTVEDGMIVGTTLGSRFSYKFNELAADGTIFSVISAGLCQTQVAVWTATHFVCI